MASVYSSVADFKASALGIQLTPVWSALTGGVLDRMLTEVSDYADSYTKRKLGAPPSTTLSAVASNTNTIMVTNGANIHERDVAVFADGTVVEVQGVELTFSAGPPYTGTVTLASNVTESNNTGVAFYRQDQLISRGKSTDPLDQSVAMSQQGQIALAHAPQLGLSSFARKLMLPEWPLWSVYAAYQTMPWTGSTAEIKADMSNVVVMRAGTIKLPIGFPNFIGSIWRVQYSAGFVVVPHDLRDAVHFLLASRLISSLNSFGASSYRIDTNMQVVGQGAAFEAEGQKLLARYVRKA